MAKPIFTDQTTSTIFFAIGRPLRDGSSPKERFTSGLFFNLLLIYCFFIAWPCAITLLAASVLSQKYLMVS